MPRYSYRSRRAYRSRRRRGSRTARSAKRAIRRVWYSWPSRFSRRLTGAMVSSAAITGFKTAWWLGMKMSRWH